jgi:2-(1,2-epoxy-1,2-dihydrophenyl)acetyl-CoA isomerase
MASCTESSLAHLQITGRIATLVLNRPERRNGMIPEMVSQVYDQLMTVASRSEISVLIVTGAGADFCVGADITGDYGDGEEISYGVMAPKFHITTLLHEMPQVTIASIDGGCAGAGLAWATACDMRIASSRARFSTAFLDVGGAGDMGMAWVLMNAIGPARARDLMYFPRKFDADTALSFGLVSRLFSAETLADETRSLAEQLADKSSFALKVMKANFSAAERLTLHDYIELEGARHMHVLQGPEMRGAFDAFAARSRSRKTSSSGS